MMSMIMMAMIMIEMMRMMVMVLSRISFAKTATLGLKFATATRNIRQVGISDWGKYGENGVETANPSFPYRLRFHPTGNISFPDTYARPTTEDLVTIPSGSVLYQVFALDVPEQLGGEEKRIADLVLTSEVVTSKWGDQPLFIRHQDMAEDLQLRPTPLHQAPRHGRGPPAETNTSSSGTKTWQR